MHKCSGSYVKSDWCSLSTIFMHGKLYEGPAKISVTNRLPKFYPRYILKCFTALQWCFE